MFTYTNTQGPAANSDNTTRFGTSTRNEGLPRYERSDLQSNFYVYRTEVIKDYIDGSQDGVYHLYTLKADASVAQEFTNLQYGQNVTDLYPQLDRDNVDDSPLATKTKALNFPLGQVYTSDLKGSITREAATDFIKKLTKNLTVSSSTALSGGISTVTFTKNHDLNGAVTGSLTAGSADRTWSSGITTSYYNVKLLTGSGAGTWEGATARVNIASQAITGFEIQSRGSGYSSGDNLYFDTTDIGGTSDAYVTLSTAGIATAFGNVVQFTGITTISDAYYRIVDVPATNKIAIARTSGDPIIAPNQVVVNVGPSVSIDSASFASQVTTFVCDRPHELVSGNKFRVIDTNNNNLGDFIVDSKSGVSTFTATTTTSLSNPKYILRHYFSSNAGVSDASSENLKARGQTFYDNDEIQISNGGSSIGISTTLIPVEHLSGIGTEQRFPIGSYVQVDNEIMRVSASSLSGANNLNVVRGVLSSQATTHSDGSIIRKIRPIPVEFRRPSIIRASGHTFEYLGYGPGNYSTGLPQVQTRTLTESEEFLSQSQERAGGIVVYTGMNNKGDFYIGNTKKSASTGQETSYDTPIPTVTGENPARLSAIFDEVTIKERLVVEGGESQQILSQFDGPVTFGKDVRFKEKLFASGKVKITNETESTNTSTGALVISGGLGVGGNLNIGGNLGVDQINAGITTVSSLEVSDLTDNQIVIAGVDGELEGDANLTFNGTKLDIGATTESTSTSTGALVVDGGVGIAKNVNIGGSMFFPDNKKLSFGDDADLEIYHNGSNSYIDNDTGHFLIRNRNTDSNLYIQANNGNNYIVCNVDNSTQLYFDNTKTFETTSFGALVTGELYVTDDITAFWTSDERLKDNITPIENSFNSGIASLTACISASVVEVHVNEAFVDFPPITFPLSRKMLPICDL